MNLPKRQFLPHLPPHGLPGHPIYFLTICTSPRGENQLCHPETAQKIFAATSFYHLRSRWWTHLMLLMPDHLHALTSFPVQERMASVVGAWKHYLSSNANVVWQRDFFDHRLRNRESFDEKASYIRRNPVRAGLIPEGGHWACVWEPTVIQSPAVTE